MNFSAKGKGERGTRPFTRLVLRDAWLIVISVLTLLTSTALLLRIPTLPVSPHLRMNEVVSTEESNVHLVGGEWLLLSYDTIGVCLTRFPQDILLCKK